MQQIMVEYLSEDGVYIRTASNGEVALQVLEQFTPDLILLDLMMPQMDGATFLTHLRRDPRYAGLSVVVVTAQRWPMKNRPISLGRQRHRPQRG